MLNFRPLAVIAAVAIWSPISASPIGSFNISPSPSELGIDVAFDGSASFETNPLESIIRYDWDFGDGSTPLDDAGPNVIHQFVFEGLFTVRLTVHSSDGSINSDTEIHSVTSGAASVPEPSTFALLCGSILGVMALRRRLRR